MLCSLASDAFKRGSAAVSVNVHLFASCCALSATSGKGKCHTCLLAVKFYEGFCKCEVAVPAVSRMLLQSLTPATNLVSQSSQSIVVRLCILVAKQQLACSHTKLCHAELQRERDTLSLSNKALYIHTHNHRV